jgi:hypothetical protein
MDVPTVGTAIAGATLAWQIGKAIHSRVTNNPLRDPRVRRWRELVQSHGLDPLTALIRLGVEDAAPTVAMDNSELAKRLLPSVLTKTSQLFNVREEWLLGCDDLPYDTMLLDRSFAPLMRDLVAWQSSGTGHGLVAFKTQRAELEVDGCQQGSLVLVREMDENDEHPTLAFRPIGSLHSWAEPAQRWLALRAIWAAWYLHFAIRGYDATERQCDRLREGRLFPGTLRRTWGVGSWHPDDYVVRPSEAAKGSDELIEAIERDHREELVLLAEASGCDVRPWGAFRELVVGR